MHRNALLSPDRRASWRTVISITATVVLAACASTVTPTPRLYQRLGGEAGVKDFVARTVDRSATDPRTKRSFDGIKLPALKDSIAQQICSLAGGGCRYEGDTMKAAHADAHIKASEFDAMVTILREEIDRAGVDTAAKNDLLRLLAPMKREVIDGGVNGRGA